MLRCQVSQPNGEVVITNDGATIMNKMVVTQPAAKMLVELSKSQVRGPGLGATRSCPIMHVLMARMQSPSQLCRALQAYCWTPCMPRLAGA